MTNIQYAAFRAEVKQLRALVADLTDPDPCHYDHHGHCQVHNWFATTPACPHARARTLGIVTEETP